MQSQALILIGSSEAALACPIVEEVISLWPAKDRPHVSCFTMDQAIADENLFDHARTVWLIVDDESTPDLQELIARLQDRHRAAVITRKNETLPIGAAFADNIAAAPKTSPPVAICAMLRTLWNQSEIIRALLTEIEILNAHNGGLATQFDKLDEELRLAAQLQREFLPTGSQATATVDYRVLFRPASYVSGDIYDVIKLDDTHIGFFIADAVGHGVPAALMTVYIKRSLRTGKRMDDQGKTVRIIPPDEALAHLNRDMIRQQNGHVRFATACYGILDTATRLFTFARAGHPYPMLLRAGGEIEWLEPEGGLLGVFPDEEFHLAHVQLEAGDRLLLYSDGFEVAFPDVVQKNGGKKRVANTAYTEEFKELAHGSLDEAFARLTRRLDEQAGSLNQIDDLTALLVSISEEPVKESKPSKPSLQIAGL
ncbi:MAG: PP2C family protein-serine/threonine phosphatase [Phycisphaeraceae bacterium]